MGGIIPPITAKLCLIMSRRKQILRGISLSSSGETSSRSHCLCVPVWLMLYWLDMEICNSGYFRRRRLLRFRNEILGFLSVPSGSAWEVRCNKPLNERVLNERD